MFKSGVMVKVWEVSISSRVKVRMNPVWVPRLRIDPLHLLAGCCKR